MKKNIFLYQNHLDTLRALAVLLVFLFHINKDFFGFGYIGVDIFFVISGYVISQSLIQTKYTTNKISFLEFYTKRILRLFPSLLLMVVIFFSLYLILVNYGDFELKLNFKSSLYSLLGLSNFYFFSNLDQFNYFQIDDYKAPLIHTWSLGVEEQFYFIYPLLVISIFYLISKVRNSFQCLFLFLSVLQLLSFYVFANSFNISHFYLPFSRAWELLTGCLLFLSINDYSNKLVGKKIIYISATLFFSFFILFLFLNSEFNEKYLIIASTFFTIFYIIFYKKFPKFLYQNNLISHFGKASYSIYLWHMPIIFFCNLYFKSYIFYVMSVFFTFLFSCTNYIYVEPVRHNKILKKKTIYFLKFMPLIIIFLVSLLVFNNKLIFGNFLHNTIVSIDKNFSFININKGSQKDRLTLKWELSVDDCMNSHENFKKINYLNCIKNSDTKDLYYLMGDSYGLHFINVLAKNKHIKNLYYGRLDNGNFSDKKDKNTAKYTKSNYDKVKKQFYGSKTVIISINYPKDLNYKKLNYFINTFDDENIIFISPHLFKTNNDKCETTVNNFKICYVNKDTKNIAKFKSNINVLKNNNKNIDIYDLTSFFCNSNACTNYIEEIDLYVFVDNFSHFTKEFANYISSDFYIFLKSINN
jgi:peptidoglycan/LPS O-acetylase OafA/YrhL